MNLPKGKALLELGDNRIEKYFQYFVVFEG